MLQDGVSHRCVCVKLSAKGGVSHHFGGVLASLENYRAICGIAAIVSRYRAIWGHKANRCFVRFGFGHPKSREKNFGGIC